MQNDIGAYLVSRLDKMYELWPDKSSTDKNNDLVAAKCDGTSIHMNSVWYYWRLQMFALFFHSFEGWLVC